MTRNALVNPPEDFGLTGLLGPLAEGEAAPARRRRDVRQAALREEREAIVEALNIPSPAVLARVDALLEGVPQNGVVEIGAPALRALVAAARERDTLKAAEPLTAKDLDTAEAALPALCERVRNLREQHPEAADSLLALLAGVERLLAASRATQVRASAASARVRELEEAMRLNLTATETPDV